MNREFRRLVLAQLAKSAGIVTDLVRETLGNPKKVMNYRALGSVGPGTSVMVPENPVKPDGSVNIVIQIRGIAGGDTKAAAAAGGGAVVVTAEAGGIGSKENLSAFGSANFVQEAVNKVIGFLKKQPEFTGKNVHLGKLTISSFSGGGSATAQLLINRNQLPKGTVPPKFVFIDGLHADPNGEVLKQVAQFAKEVQKNPSAGELSLVHTAVVPKGYASTTTVADKLLQELGLQRTPITQRGEGVGPVAEAKSGGLHITQLYDKQEPYVAKDPQTGQMRPNVPGTAGWQHIQALKWGLKNVVS